VGSNIKAASYFKKIVICFLPFFSWDFYGKISISRAGRLISPRIPDCCRIIKTKAVTRGIFVNPSLPAKDNIHGGA
tara:strand:- start:493 stop:720 length:228 start_codon:yes stop_codon:yes gene_type:complete